MQQLKGDLSPALDDQHQVPAESVSSVHYYQSLGSRERSSGHYNYFAALKSNVVGLRVGQHLTSAETTFDKVVAGVGYIESQQMRKGQKTSVKRSFAEVCTLKAGKPPHFERSGPEHVLSRRDMKAFLDKPVRMMSESEAAHLDKTYSDFQSADIPAAAATPPSEPLTPPPKPVNTQKKRPAPPTTSASVPLAKKPRKLTTYNLFTKYVQPKLGEPASLPTDLTMFDWCSKQVSKVFLPLS